MSDFRPSLLCVVHGGIGDQILTLPALRFLQTTLAGFSLEVRLGGWRERRRLFRYMLGLPIPIRSLESLWAPGSPSDLPACDWALDLEFSSTPRGLPAGMRIRSGWLALPRRFERPDSLPVPVQAAGFGRQCLELACRFVEHVRGIAIDESDEQKFWDRHRPHPDPGVQTPAGRRVRERLAGLAAGRPRLAISPGGRNPREKLWPAGGFAEVARHALARSVDVFLLGSPVEQPLHREIAERVQAADGTRRPPGEGRLHSLAGWPLEDLPHVLADTGLHLGNDSGAAHVAGALDRRQVVLYRGSESPHRTLGARDTCLFSGDPAGLAQISPAEVIRHVARWIDEAAGSRPAES